MGPPIIKRGDFWTFKKSLLGNGSPLAVLDRMNVQVGAPSTFPQGDPASSQENPGTLPDDPNITESKRKQCRIQMDRERFSARKIYGM